MAQWVGLTNDVLYGSSWAGSPGGSVFSINITGNDFRTLYNFTNSADGVSPRAGLVISGQALYGTTVSGGQVPPDDIGWGTVFSAHVDGTQYQVLHRFSNATFDGTNLRPATNIDGAYPEAELILRGNTLYGTTSTGGTFGNGTVFAINTDGSGFTNLHTFTALTMSTNLDGAIPSAGLLLADGTLYGTTSRGGTSGNGTIFAIALPSLKPVLNITPSTDQVVLSWPASTTGFSLYSTTNLGGAAVWIPVSAIPVVVNGQNTVTNLIGTQQFYRLSQ